MRNPEEIIESWEKQITKEKDEDMLRCIQQDLEMELNDYESIVSRYEFLIDEINNKLEKARTKQ